MPRTIPPELEHFRDRQDGRAWLDSLDARIDAASRRWTLQVQEPYDGSHASWTAAATRLDGTAAVLKVPFPHREARYEAQALEAWNGNGAVRLLDFHVESGDLLLEQLQPGIHLSSVGNEAALEVYIDLLPRLWVAADIPFARVSDEARRWASSLPARWERSGRLYDERLMDAAVSLLTEAAASVSESDMVLVHQDMHADNIVSATRKSWLAIDPKPLVGPREFSVAPVVRSTELGHSKALVLRRFDRLVEALELDAGAARAWTIGQTVAWATGGSDVVAAHIETAIWLLESR